MRPPTSIRRDLSFLADRPIAHRGLHEPARSIIENTASAFEAAIGAGFAIECDLQLTGDGEAVVFHDDSLERLIEGEGDVRLFSAKQLRSLKFKQTTDCMQILPELLEQVAGRSVLIIELKSHWDGNVDLVHRTVRCVAGYRGPFALMSFDPDMVEAVRKTAPQVVRGITADKATDPYYNKLPLPKRTELLQFGHMERARPHFISYDWHDLPAAHITQFRATGFPVITWTIRSKEEAAKALRYSDQMTFEGFHP